MKLKLGLLAIIIFALVFSCSKYTSDIDVPLDEIIEDVLPDSIPEQIEEIFQDTISDTVTNTVAQITDMVVEKVTFDSRPQSGLWFVRFSEGNVIGKDHSGQYWINGVMKIEESALTVLP